MTRKPQASNENAKSKLITMPIAIIGMGSIFPKARTTQAYWDNILRKIDCVTDIPESRWSIDDYFDPDPSVPDKTYCKRGGFIPDIDFDPMEFGLPPNILEVTDVSQLISLLVAKEALEDAGCGENSDFDREHTGCILGYVGTSSKLFTPLMTRLQYPVWRKVLLSVGISESETDRIIEKIKLAYVGWEENSFPGAIGNVVAGRICNRFDLGGTNSVVDAACASSLSAIKMAVGELIEGRANVMLTGGVDTDNSINSYMCFSKTPAFTKKENVRPFDAESGGMMVGEGLGMIVLKRLEDAERDGDRIYAVIRAIGTSSDGRYKSIYAPRSEGQSRALRRAYEEAGFPPYEVGLIEAHGTGTMAGDPAEFQGLRDTFSEGNPRKQHIALGSVKSQIAHTKAAAGVASMMKVSLALYHKVLPPTINVTRPNPKLGIEDSPFYINTETRPWIRAKGDGPRRAGVSSFGFGGTNFHVVLEEYEAEQSSAYRINTVAHSILMSAVNPSELLQTCRQANQNLSGDMAQVNFNNLIKNSRFIDIHQDDARIGFVAETVDEARQALQIVIDNLPVIGQQESWEHPKGIFYRRSGIDTRGKVVALFSGQGSQYLDMGRELAVNFPVVREVFSVVDELFASDGLEPLSTRVYPKPVFDQKERDILSENLTKTEHAQPAIGVLSVSLYKLLHEAGFKADFIAGHSFGELTALWAAGVLSEENYFMLSKARGKAMAPPADASFDAGSMMAVKGDVEKIQDALRVDTDVILANWNSNNQVVIAGSKQALGKAQEILTGLGFQVIPLPVSAAFHTPLVSHAQKPFAKVIRKTPFINPSVRVFSNSTGKAHSDNPEIIRDVLEGHILNPVLFRDEIENIYAEGGSIFVEFGPKNVLTNLVGNILSDRPHLALALNPNPKKDSDRQLREAVVALKVAGLPLKNFDPYAAEMKISAPAKKSPVTVSLHGGYYVSDKTRKAFEDALNDGFRITSAGKHDSLPESQPVFIPQSDQKLIVANTAEVSQKEIIRPEVPQTVGAHQSMKSNPAAHDEIVLDEFQAHQSETQHLHEQYLRMEEEYARAFEQMIALQAQLISRSTNDLQSVLPLFESLERSMARFHDHQAETLKIHQHYLETQANLTNLFVQGYSAVPSETTPSLKSIHAQTLSQSTVLRGNDDIVISHPVDMTRLEGIGANGHNNVAGKESLKPTFGQIPVASAIVAQTQPIPASSATSLPGIKIKRLQEALLEIVSEKTGYPTETLDLEMDMEADLGIDSIKRVEILGAMQTQFPDLPKIEATDLAELHTLGQIIAALGSGGKSDPQPEGLVGSIISSNVVTEAVQQSIRPASSGIEEVKNELLAVVSEKTGYPIETLELDMDMEADLGIDSIKRVEILGAIQSKFPDLPKIDATELAELRTLGQIVDHLGDAAENLIKAPAYDVKVKSEQNLSVLSPEAPVISSPDVKAVSATLLAIVSEKTGYPAETLELDMNLEADLGIDSIKRVEILGALQEKFPDLPKVDSNLLAELGTLGQIIDHMSQVNDIEVSQPSEGGTAVSPFDLPFDAGIEQDVVIRKILPPPDSLDFKLPEKHICLVTDDGTDVTPALVEKLLSRNWPVVVLRFPEALVPVRSEVPSGAAVSELPNMSEAALRSCLADITGRFGPVAVFIHLSSSLDGNGENNLEFPEREKSLLKLVFLAAKHLKPVLTSAAEKGRAVFLTVARLDGQFGLSGESLTSPVSGGLFGLVKTLNLEWESVFCRAVDLSPSLPPEQAVKCIFAEITDPNRLVTEIGYTLTERSTLALAPLTIPILGRHLL